MPSLRHPPRRILLRSSSTRRVMIAAPLVVPRPSLPIFLPLLLAASSSLSNHNNIFIMGQHRANSFSPPGGYHPASFIAPTAIASSSSISALCATIGPGTSRGDYFPSLNGNDGEGGEDRVDRTRRGDVAATLGGGGRVGGGGVGGSHIVYIRSSNIAGMIGGGDDGGGGVDGKDVASSSGVRIDFGNEACFVAVTGERFGIDPTIIDVLPPSRIGDDDDSSHSGILRLERTLSDCGGGGGGGGRGGRWKSTCRINGKHVSLSTLREIAGPLFARVDVGVASAALGRSGSRLAMIDTGVPYVLRRHCAISRDEYVYARKRREGMERDLESRILPSGLLRGADDGGDGDKFDEGQMTLLRHWVDELDAFEGRMARFQQALSARDDDDDELGGKGGGFHRTMRRLRRATWGGMQQRGGSDDDSLFTSLIDFREEIKAAEARMVSAHSAYELLASLTVPNSASVALENVRKLLFAMSADRGGPLFEAIERTHELLNDVEASLNDCARSIDGDLISTLEKMAFTGIPLETVDGIIADWNALARKHGISPYSLPNCHMSMREELDGNVEAMRLLPEAREKEDMARADYSRACRVLSDARKEVAKNLSQSVSNILPSLGLDGSVLRVKLSSRTGGFEDPYYGTETVGVDIAEFQLIHQKSSNGRENGGSIEQVGSSGEKSRILLAIETALPGSIGSTCNSFGSAEHVPYQHESKIPPIAIIYDEIDAHVGGRAAVTMAKLLADQSRARRASDGEGTPERGSQIIAITHSASLAAIADRHIVVERCLNTESRSVPIRTYVVDGTSRRKEIARMASGDLASGEAEQFADALIREATLQREMSLAAGEEDTRRSG
ncbi:hypothetical protein ACHAXA_000314 [Cyclostephanos tholiformis]|uniref:DNA repair protein RecN n=1 Tax=Cyclostephanos tholiformis TaxID=382380 RepID=A0ABD3R4W4_9STRA